MKNLIQSLKGTRDFYPEDMAVRTWLYGKVRKVSESFGYQEYEGPFLESIELYAAKSGEELVKEQSFVFPDRGGDLITLRPELTPTLARMIAQRQRQLIYPVRWWSFGPFWRYERPQKGRTREFFQWNIDLIGVDTPEADAEMVAIVANFFREVGLSPKQVSIMVNNRKLVDSELADLKVPPQGRPDVFRLIDRREKMRPVEWVDYAGQMGLDQGQIEGLKKILASTDLWRKSKELVRFFEVISALGVSDYVRYEPSIIRGLDYYTGTVFEAQELEGDIRRSILGGGRYDNLLADVGGDPLPAVGFAMGDVVVTLILQQYGLVPQSILRSPASVLVTIFDEEYLLPSFALAAELRCAGLKVACFPEPARLGKQFKFADRIGARVAVVLGPDEIKNGQVAIKNLATGDQETVSRPDAAKTIQQMLDRASSS